MNRRRFAEVMGTVSMGAALAIMPISGRAACGEQDERNAETVRRFVDEVINGGNVDLLDEIGHPDYEPTDPNDAPGRDAWKRRLIDTAEGRAKIIPDFAIAIDEMIAADDRVAMRARVTGNTTAGKKLAVLMLSWFVFRDGRIVQGWDLQDLEALAAAL